MRLAVAGRKPPQQGVEARDRGQVQAVEHGDRAAQPVAAVEAVGYGQQDNRQQEEQVEKNDATAAMGIPRQPAVVTEPEQSGDDEAEDEPGEPSRIKMIEVDPVRQTLYEFAGRVGPARQALELAGLGQVIGEQGHGNAKNGVAQRFQPAHLEMVGVGGGHLGRRSWYSLTDAKSPACRDGCRRYSVTATMR